MSNYSQVKDHVAVERPNVKVNPKWAHLKHPNTISNQDSTFILSLCTDILRFQKDHAENTHLLRKGKYHCMADLLFDQLGFGQTSKSVYSFNSTK